MGSNVILVRKSLVEISGSRRSIGVFRCPECLVEFETRMERAKVMTGLCIPCANKAAGRKRATHGLNNSNSRLHVTWANMKRRCLKPRGSEIQKYHGVTLCEEWMSFEPFMEWSLANGYSDRLTLDRIESAKGYEPGNCRYADYNVQAANRRLTDKNTSGHVGINWSRINGPQKSSGRKSRFTWGDSMTSRMQ
ncbi:hypothetical protein HX813_24240 [Pseudomonas yamanorum]|uniref:hypothetical protein n=1 Tax=Pseudomonas yamanorum TaxID=515393 RepID=UPI0015A1A4D5|nr:hypothetical protein [Pseudomonas yamanorum]NVZ91348.1 hypothetical protein [Pseudomonas yamanorum]